MGVYATMTSTFTWLDYSERERRKMLEVVHTLKEQDTRDELGIGAIRDGIADMLFPGTGTVQSRARYFLFIPWIYADLENKGTSSRDIAEKARQREIELIDALLVGGEKKGGIIGIEARKDLQRLPSNIYWQGLGRWGIRGYKGSQDQYHRSLDRWYQFQEERTPSDRGEHYDDGARRPNWHAEIPEPVSKWRQSVDFALLRPEALFLRDCVLSQVPASLLANLVTVKKVIGRSDFVWESELNKQFPAKHQEILHHARNFSEAMRGASILYNLLLARKADKRDLAEQYKDLMHEWSDKIMGRQKTFSEWDRQAFWTMLDDNNVRITLRTKGFVSDWLNMMLSATSPALLANDKYARSLIQQREVDLKKGLARLENQRALELWNEAAGLAQIDYRWRITQRIVNDILEGLGYA